MTDWIEKIACFSAAIRDESVVTTGIAGGLHYPTERGLAVYRNNYRGNLHDTLAAAYPVVLQLVGADFFRYMACQFIEATPSRSGNLTGYGASLGDFIADFSPAKELPYLADVARLEWCYHCAFFADDATPLDVARLSNVSPENYENLRWKLQRRWLPDWPQFMNRTLST